MTTTGLFDVAHVAIDPETHQIACGVCGDGDTVEYDVGSIVRWTLAHVVRCAQDALIDDADMEES